MYRGTCRHAARDAPLLSKNAPGTASRWSILDTTPRQPGRHLGALVYATQRVGFGVKLRPEMGCFDVVHRGSKAKLELGHNAIQSCMVGPSPDNRLQHAFRVAPQLQATAPTPEPGKPSADSHEQGIRFPKRLRTGIRHFACNDAASSKVHSMTIYRVGVDPPSLGSR